MKNKLSREKIVKDDLETTNKIKGKEQIEKIWNVMIR